MAAYYEIQEERDELKMEFMIKREAECKDLENFYSVKNEKIHLGENTNSVFK